MCLEYLTKDKTRTDTFVQKYYIPSIKDFSVHKLIRDYCTAKPAIVIWYVGFFSSINGERIEIFVPKAKRKKKKFIFIFIFNMLSQRIINVYIYIVIQNTYFFVEVFCIRFYNVRFSYVCNPEAHIKNCECLLLLLFLLHGACFII